MSGGKCRWRLDVRAVRKLPVCHGDQACNGRGAALTARESGYKSLDWRRKNTPSTGLAKEEHRGECWELAEGKGHAAFIVNLRANKIHVFGYEIVVIRGGTGGPQGS